jgi:hypothetical protein
MERGQGGGGSCVCEGDTLDAPFMKLSQVGELSRAVREAGSRGSCHGGPRRLVVVDLSLSIHYTARGGKLHLGRPASL